MAVVPSTSRAGSSAFSADTNMPWEVGIVPSTRPIATTGTWVLTSTNSDAMGGSLTNTGAPAVNDAISYYASLAAGTWTLQVAMITSGTSGIATVQVNGSSVGTIDAYSAATTHNVVLTLVGIVIATTARQTVKFLMATKNASSTNFAWFCLGYSFLRTA